MTAARTVAGCRRTARSAIAGPSQQPTRTIHATSSAHQIRPSNTGDAAGPSRNPQPTPSSIHASEIAHFTRLSSSWWDPNGELSLLHKMNKGRIAFLKDKMVEVAGWEAATRRQRMSTQEQTEMRRDWVKGKKVLDVGCGGGLLSESLARLGADVHGIDATQTNIAIAQAHAARDPFFSSSNATLRYEHRTAESLLPEEPQRYDVVASVEVLEHVSNPADFLRSLGALLKPGGHLLLSTINRNALSWIITIGVAEKWARLVSPGTHSWSQFVKPEELTKFLCQTADVPGGGLGWYPGTTDSLDNASVENSSERVDRPSLHDTQSLPPPRRLQIETRGIVYDPFLSSDWTLLDRSAWMQRSGLGQGCNYLLWARKPLR